jgi:hypothetical protein
MLPTDEGGDGALDCDKLAEAVSWPSRDVALSTVWPINLENGLFADRALESPMKAVTSEHAAKTAEWLA